MTRSPRLVALVPLVALFLAACAGGGSPAANATPADIYAAIPSIADVRALMGDKNWWAQPPSYEVRPLDAQTIPFTVRYSVSEAYIHVGTAEELIARYTVYDKTSSATTVMTNYQTAFGASPSTPKVGDQVLYYGLSGSGGAPYVTRTIVRVGQLVLQIVLATKDPITTAGPLGRNAAKFVGGITKLSKVHVSTHKVDPKLLPPPGLDVTLLGATQLPIESWVVMIRTSLPGPVLALLTQQGITKFVYGDYALNNDTHMEVQTAILAFQSGTDAISFATTFAPGTPDTSGIASAYIPSGGTPAAGVYDYLFVSGSFVGMLTCHSSISGEAASRECESPMERTAVAWMLALGGLS